MKERPILFSGPMVRALLAGRKTQTRRALRIQPPADTRRMYPIETLDFSGQTGEWVAERLNKGRRWTDNVKTKCPYGVPGDGLWVKETWRTAVQWDALAPSQLPIAGDMLASVHIDYLADEKRSQHGKTRVSIHMPKWACRLHLDVTGVRVERLQEISEEDAKAEDEIGYGSPSPKKAYSDLWQSINGPGSWDKNPWVWVIEFKRGD